MKQVSISFLLIALPFWVFSNPVTSNLEEARIFLQGAQIYRTAQAQVPAGTHEIIITDLPVQIDANSIQLRGQGDFTILSVSHRVNYLESPQVTNELAMLRDSLEYYKTQLEVKQAILKVYEEEESLILTNKSIGGSEAGVKVADLRAVSDFFRSRLAEVKQLQINTRQEVNKLQERHSRIRNQIGQISARQNQAVGQIVVTTSSSRAVRGNFDFSFVTMQAGWNPLYDIRADETSRPLNVAMKANVFQNTGEDWNNIQLTLSTGSPAYGGQKPNLSPWFLRFIQPIALREAPARGARMAPTQEMYNADDEVMIMVDMAKSVMEVVTISETQTTTEYRISIPYTIPTGNQKQMVEVQKTELTAGFEYYTVPKLDRDVYLVGKVTGWEEFIRLPGEANLFFEGTYVGKTFIDPANTSDTLELSLGRDRGIVIERNRLTDVTRKGILGRRVTETVGWELVARNNKRQPITLNIQDQIPLSTDGVMEIRLEEQSGAIHQESTGFLTWKINLSPGETQKRQLRYTVRYPADRKLHLE
jgi:uncharacterized protein (TIGR02231 family)